MKKRRVLALLLALSLAVSMNGMTVLATGPDAVDFPVTAGVDDNTVKEGEQAADTQKGDDTQQPEDSKEGEQTDDGQGNVTTTGDETGSGTADNAGGSGSEVTDGAENDPTPGDHPEDQDNPDDQIQDGETGKEDQPDQPSEGEDGTGSAEKPGDGDLENPDDNASEEAGDAAQDDPEESVSDNTLEEEELPRAAKQEVRLMTFTDDTGMRVTYNANAEYSLDIVNGVLNGIKDADGTDVEGVVVLPEGKGITAIGAAFSGNANITYVRLPGGVTSIQDNAFNNCYQLQGVYLPKELQTIGKNAFYRCTGLLKIAVPKQVVSIGDAAFYGNDKLFMVYMQDADYSSLVSIGDQAFYGCRVLEHFGSDNGFVVPGNLESVGASAFYDCRAIKSIEFREGLTTMGEGAFQYCNSLVSLSLPGSLKTIPKNAFSGCNKLVSLTLKSGIGNIGESAFEGCLQLGGIVIPGTVGTLANYAFERCTGLVTAEIQNTVMTFGESVFPNQSTLTLIGVAGSSTEEYTLGKNIKFVAYNSTEKLYYRYVSSYFGDGIGKLEIKNADGADPNTLNKNQGVEAGTKLYVYVNANSGSRLVPGSIKCNGDPVKEEKGASGEASKLYFEMPVGGARITAEFASTASNNRIEGQEQDVKVELSYGDVTTDSNGAVRQVTLKAGQYSRMFLTDAQDDNKAIPSSKIAYRCSNTAVATVAGDGTIHAIKQGYCQIDAKVTGGDGTPFTKSVRVDVTTSDVAQLSLKAERYSTPPVQIETSSISGIQTAVIDKNKWNGKTLEFELKATAYDVDKDNIAVALKWSSSDAKVAKLSRTATTVDNSRNTVTIPSDTSGEATIHVTATNADKKTVTQKFIIRVIDRTPRLVSNSLTINPNRTDGALLQIVSAYGKQVDPDRVRLVRYDSDHSIVACTDFDFTYLAQESDSTVTTFRVNTPYQNVNDQVSNVFVEINGGQEYAPLPLKITVKNSRPNPKIAYEKKQPKINLFYANDETDVIVNVSNLGKEQISDFVLMPLSEKEDDKKFTENFEVEQVDKDTCVIRQAVDNLKCDIKGKPVLTGNLRLYYEGYSENIYKDFKITIPAQRVAPAYKLDRTTDTFLKGGGEQEVELQLVDKKNQPIDLSESGYVLSIIDDGTSISSPVQESGTVDIDETGKFVLTLWGEIAGKVKLRLTNSLLWAEDEKLDFTYTVKLTNSIPKISLTDGPTSTAALKSSTITVNPNYPGSTVEFGMKSNQKGTAIADEQVFREQRTGKLAEYYQYLDVQYVNGVGSVSILDSAIKDGTYTYVCDKVQYLFRGVERPANKITLKVKVQRANPTVTVKGSLLLNNAAKTNDDVYEEQSELTLITKNLPEGYEFDYGETIATLKCTTRNKSDYVNYFDWELIDRQTGEDGKITEGKLVASLNQYCEKGTYTFTIQPAYSGSGELLRAQKAVKFSVKVHEGTISIALSQKGKINLLDRSGQSTASNSIVYTPSVKNVKDKVTGVRVFDCDPKTGNVNFEGAESDKFEAQILTDGKIYVRPKEDAELKSNESYKVRIWMELEKYKFPVYVTGGDGGIASKVLTIKTAQTLPKVITDRSTVNLYLSNKNYVAAFIVNKSDEKAIGSIESIAFGEKDTKAQESFVTTADTNGKETVIESEQLEDGSLLVRLKLRDGVLYGCDTTNKITMYVRFEGQGTNTAGTAITMNVKINK